MRMRMTGYSGLILIGRCMNSRDSNAPRMEVEIETVMVVALVVVVEVGGDVARGWSCLEVAVRMVCGDDERVAIFKL